MVWCDKYKLRKKIYLLKTYSRRIFIFYRVVFKQFLLTFTQNMDMFKHFIINKRYQSMRDDNS